MILYLCGGGSGNQIKDIYKDLNKQLVKNNNKPILYIPLAIDPKNYNNCAKWFQEEIKYIGNYQYEMIKSSLELSQKDLNNYNALFIGGGNTYRLLSELKKYNLQDKIRKYLEEDGIIFGSSAGAIIFGKDIDTCKIDDNNYPDLKDTFGFNLINNYSILCHLNKRNFTKNIFHLKRYSQKQKVLYLRENTVIKITKDKIMLMGNKKYIIIKDGIYYNHNFANFKNDFQDK